MLARRKYYMMILSKTKPISVEKHSMSMGVEKHYLRGVLKTNTSKRQKLTQLCPLDKDQFQTKVTRTRHDGERLSVEDMRSKIEVQRPQVAPISRFSPLGFYCNLFLFLFIFFILFLFFEYIIILEIQQTAYCQVCTKMIIFQDIFLFL